MANQITPLSYANTFGDWVTTTNSVLAETNDMVQTITPKILVPLSSILLEPVYRLQIMHLFKVLSKLLVLVHLQQFRTT